MNFESASLRRGWGWRGYTEPEVEGDVAGRGSNQFRTELEKTGKNIPDLFSSQPTPSTSTLVLLLLLLLLFVSLSVCMLCVCVCVSKIVYLKIMSLTKEQ